jgi:hypothetical protein
MHAASDGVVANRILFAAPVQTTTHFDDGATARQQQ